MLVALAIPIAAIASFFMALGARDRLSLVESRLNALEARLAACKLELHPQKTKIVYCKDSNRPNGYPKQRFDFLGFTFRPRQSMNRAGKLFVSFSPAVSDKAAKVMREDVRRWKLHHRNDLDLEKIAQWARPILVGWVNYYGRFHRSALRRALRTVDPFIVRWAQRKYKRLRGHAKRAWGWLRGCPGFC